MLPDYFYEFIHNFPSVNTRDSYNRDLKNFVAFVGNDDPKTWTFKNMMDYRDSIAITSTTNTVNRSLSGVKSFLTWAIARGFVNSNVGQMLKLPKPAVSKPTEALTDVEVKRMLALPLKPRDRLILTLLLNSAMRCSELLNLATSDIYEVDSHTVIRIVGKGGKLREIPLNDSVKVLLKTHLATLKSESLFSLASSSIYRLVVKYAQRAGVKKRITPHSLRATAITKALEQNAVITDVADLAGHSSINTTQGYWKRRRGLNESPAYKLNF